MLLKIPSCEVPLVCFTTNGQRYLSLSQSNVLINRNYAVEDTEAPLANEAIPQIQDENHCCVHCGEQAVTFLAANSSTQNRSRKCPIILLAGCMFVNPPRFE